VKLFCSLSSPYVRKVLACAIARELEDQFEMVPVDPWSSPAALLAVNPLSKVPTLVTDDGRGLFDSPVICEYLDSLEGNIPLFPRTAGARWKALTYQAMADGILDAAVARRREGLRPPTESGAAVIARQKAVTDRTLGALEADPPPPSVDIGTISVGCALGYLDFRFAGEPWREANPRLAAWFTTFSRHPCMARTVPKDAA
jgi:glutathione S-transferase